MNQELKHIREEIHAKLMAYPTRDPEVVETSWKYTGLAGGHRAYLGDEQASTLMALSFGGFGYWWYKDREALGAMTEAWNADQAHREESGLPPKETYGLVIVEPNELETPPGWINDPPGLIERLLAGYFKLAVQLNRMITQPFKRGVLGAEYAKKWGDLEEKASMIAIDLSERIQLGLFCGIVSVLAAAVGAVEVSVLIMGICLAMSFPGFLVKRQHRRWAKLALEWDYLVCCYYYKNRPPMPLHGFILGCWQFLPRLLGRGDKAEQTLFARFASQTALLGLMFIPIDLIFSLGDASGIPVLSFMLQTVTGLVISILLATFSVPIVCGGLARQKLQGERYRLYISGGVGFISAFIGLIFGYTFNLVA